MPEENFVCREGGEGTYFELIKSTSTTRLDEDQPASGALIDDRIRQYFEQKGRG